MYSRNTNATRATLKYTPVASGGMVITLDIPAGKPLTAARQILREIDKLLKKEAKKQRDRNATARKVEKSVRISRELHETRCKQAVRFKRRCNSIKALSRFLACSQDMARAMLKHGRQLGKEAMIDAKHQRWATLHDQGMSCRDIAKAEKAKTWPSTVSRALEKIAKQRQLNLIE